MSDLSRFLPLSQRSAARVAAADRSAQLAGVIRTAADVLPVADHAAFARDAGIGLPSATTLVSRAAELDASRPRTSLRALARGVRALLRRAPEAPLDAQVVGSVALHASATASFDRRAAVSGHTVRATDADWSFGRGPDLVSPARDILTFLLGLTDTPPRPPVR